MHLHGDCNRELHADQHCILRSDVSGGAARLKCRRRGKYHIIGTVRGSPAHLCECHSAVFHNAILFLMFIISFSSFSAQFRK